MNCTKNLRRLMSESRVIKYLPPNKGISMSKLFKVIDSSGKEVPNSLFDQVKGYASKYWAVDEYGRLISIQPEGGWSKVLIDYSVEILPDEKVIENKYLVRIDGSEFAEDDAFNRNKGKEVIPKRISEADQLNRMIAVSRLYFLSDRGMEYHNEHLFSWLIEIDSDKKYEIFSDWLNKKFPDLFS